jgi:hypothetical protein
MPDNKLTVILMKPNTYQKIALWYLLFLVIYWGALLASGLRISNYNFGYSLAFTLVPLFGGLVGMIKSGIWGRLHSAIGRAVFFFSLGLFLWGCGNTVWAYYNFILHVAAPYPSWADIGFAPSIFFWALGALSLARATGAKYGLRPLWAKLFAVAAPVSVLTSSYYLLIVVARGGVLTDGMGANLKPLFDIAYPLGDVIALTLAVVIFGLSFRFFGGRYKKPVLYLLAGLGIMYIGDFVFSYTTTVGCFYNGDIGDMILTLGLFCIAFGVLGFCDRPAVGDGRGTHGAQ